MILRISKLFSLAACIGLLPMAFISNAYAEERITDDYIALIFEAEDDDTRGERWVLMNSSTPEQDNDPDGNHSDGAAGGAYIELLPDMRVTHDDEFGPPTAIWNQAGTGPRAEYTMNFPEAGRYYVHIRAYSTGTEDNGIHVGHNGIFPESGARMQFCTAGTGWQWSSKQRESGGVGPCGVRKTIWITVEEPGLNTFMISAREDGFEADRIMLIKDLSDNTRICSPSGIDNINCQNGTLENVDDVVDMSVTATLDQTEIEVGDTVVVTAIVRNTDGYDTAEDVVLSVGEGVGTQWSATDLHAGCSVNGTSVSCNMGSKRPSSPGEEGDSEVEVTLVSVQGGALEIPVSIATSSIDDNEANDSTSQAINVIDDGSTSSALTLDLADDNPVFQANVETRVVAVTKNTGPAAASNVVVNMSVPVGLSMSSLPAGCVGVTDVQCDLNNMGVNAQVTLDFGVTPSEAGMYSISLQATASNLSGDAPNRSMLISVEEVVVEPVDPGETDAGGADTGGADTGGADAGGTDAGGTDAGGTDTGGTDTGGTDTAGTDGTTTGDTGEVGTDGAGTDGGADSADVTEDSSSKRLFGGALVWWTLLFLSFALYMRQIHVSRQQRRTFLAVSRNDK